MAESLDLYWDDLTPDFQKRLLEAEGIEDPKEANWDVHPVGFIALGSSDEEE